jgi:thioredoxin 1
MKFVKRLIVILFIAASAIVFSNIKSDISCNCEAETSFPFSLLTKIFENSGNEAVANSHEHGPDGNFSILGGVAFAQGKSSGFKATFIELGSVNCIPCKMMQPVMKQVEKKYGDQVKVLFYDVWTEEGEPYGRKYGIRAIPTQVYLDSSGKEFFRHVGFHPFEEVEKILKNKGVR